MIGRFLLLRAALKIFEMPHGLGEFFRGFLGGFITVVLVFIFLVAIFALIGDIMELVL